MPGRVPRFVAPLVSVVVLAVVALASYQLGRNAGDSSTGSLPPATSNALADPNHLKAQPIDVGFAADMIDHHDQAVQMSLLAIEKATTSAVHTHAVEIATSQRRESGMLVQFLRDRGIDHVDADRTVMAWMGEPTPHDEMPGLATPDEMLALTNATGADFDRLFVELMVRHHEGGVHMAQYAAEHAETQDIRELAARMVLAQRRELNEMQLLQGP